MSEYSHSRVYLDPLGMIVMSDGSRRQEIELVLTDDPDRDPPSLTDPVLRLNADHARQLGCELLQLAEHTERTHRARSAR